MGDIAVAAGVALFILFVGGLVSLKTIKKWGVILTTVVALIAFLSILGL